VSLRLTPEGALFREADGTLSPYATGHGDLSFALRASGALRRFREAGGKHLYVSNVDNLGATLEPAILGAHFRAGAAVTAEVVRKERGDRGGAAARLDGRPQIIEAFRFPADFDQDALPHFNTNSFVLDAAAIDRDFELTYFRVEKKVDGRAAVQFERLVGELTALLATHFVEVPRGGPDGRFQPVKDPEELAARRPEIEHLLLARGVL
jgi:UTP--glucose-1-phosphate uridylyltransferase